MADTPIKDDFCLAPLRGVTVRTGITARGPDLRIAFVEGPDGALIEILERKPA